MFVLAAPAYAQSPLPRLKVSDNKRFLVTADGKPFFWLGDTAWELFHRLNREEAERYLQNRAERRFTVIQAVALAELDGLNDPNAYGQRPLVGQRPGAARTRPYFEHVDWIVSAGQRARPLRRHAADVGRQVEQEVGRGPGDLHGRRTPRRTASGSAGATGTPASSGSSAATGRSRPTRTTRSSARWRAACAKATAART